MKKETLSHLTKLLGDFGGLYGQNRQACYRIYDFVAELCDKIESLEFATTFKDELSEMQGQMENMSYHIGKMLRSSKS